MTISNEAFSIAFSAARVEAERHGLVTEFETASEADFPSDEMGDAERGAFVRKGYCFATDPYGIVVNGTDDLLTEDRAMLALVMFNSRIEDQIATLMETILKEIEAEENPEKGVSAYRKMVDEACAAADAQKVSLGGKATIREI